MQEVRFDKLLLVFDKQDARKKYLSYLIQQAYDKEVCTEQESGPYIGENAILFVLHCSTIKCRTESGEDFIWSGKGEESNCWKIHSPNYQILLINLFSDFERQTGQVSKWITEFLSEIAMEAEQNQSNGKVVIRDFSLIEDSAQQLWLIQELSNLFP